MYIPEELILAKFSSDCSVQMIECPNLVCKAKFQPKFNVLKLREKGQSNEKERHKLLSPLRLLRKVGDFLFVRNEEELFNPEKSGHLYWNVLFWCNFMGLPSFFIQEKLDAQTYNFGIVYIDQYSVSLGKIIY